MRKLNFTVDKTADDKFYFRLRNGWNRILLTSKEYYSFDKCVNDIYVLQMHPDTCVRWQPAAGRFQFIVASGERVIARSSPYIVRRCMEADVLIIKQEIAKAAILDQSSRVKFIRVK
jgi:uncharacterized protein YegP (UPF0339 family)